MLLGFVVAFCGVLSLAPMANATAVSASRLILRWGESGGTQVGYKIERAPNPSGPWNQIAQVLPATTTYRDTGLTPNTAYYYRIRAFNAAGNSPYSNVASSRTVAITPPAVVTWGLSNTPPAGLSGVLAVECGANHTIVLKTNGAVVAWGLNTSNQATVPPGLSNVVTIAAGGNHNLAVKSDGTVVAWGSNSNGQLTVPNGLNGVVAVAAGGSHSLALRNDGSVVAWGLNTSGQTTVPTGLTGVVAIAAGGNHSLALKSDGTIIAWGLKTNGQATIPTGLNNVIAIAAGANHSLALRGDGTVVAWGLNTNGQTTVPTGLTTVIAIEAGGNHSLALRADGTLAAWGLNSNGQSTISTGLRSGVAMDGGDQHTVALATGCFYQLSRNSTNHAAASATGSVGLQTLSGCEWAASSDAGWLSTVSSGQGAGTITYSMTANTGVAARVGTISVGAETFQVTQAGSCSVTINTTAATGGSIAGAGSFPCGANVTVTATPSSGYAFVNWTEGGSVVSSSASYTFTASANRTLVANFSTVTYTVNTSASPSAGGTTSGGGSKAAGSSVTVTATTNSGYAFVNWTEGGSVVSSSASYTFTASANRSLVANFSTVTYTVNTSASPSAGGTTSGGGSKATGSSVTVTATANSGYVFVNWTAGGTVVSSSASYTFPASANRTLVANFGVVSSDITLTLAPMVSEPMLEQDDTVVVAAGETNEFVVAAVDSAGRALSYTWDFGDGTTSASSPDGTAWHVYAPACGTYPVGVTVANGVSTVSAGLTVSVACQLEVAQLVTRLRFNRQNADSCKLVGTVDWTAGTSLAGRQITLNVGDVQVEFELNRRGRGVTGKHSCRLKYMRKTGRWKVVARLRRGAWQSEWAQYGLLNGNLSRDGAPVTMPIILLVDRESFAAEPALRIRHKTGRYLIGKQ